MPFNTRIEVSPIGVGGHGGVLTLGVSVAGRLTMTPLGVARDILLARARS